MKSILPVTLSTENINPYAGFGQRASASFVDMLIMIPYIFVVTNLSRINYAVYIAVNIFAIGFSFFYTIYLLKRFGGTPGKLICGMVVLRKDGHALSWKEALLRNIVDFPYGLYSTAFSIWLVHSIGFNQFQAMSFLEFGVFINTKAPHIYSQLNALYQCWFWSELVVLLFNKRKRALHDFIAGTVVVQKTALPLIRQYIESPE